MSVFLITALSASIFISATQLVIKRHTSSSVFLANNPRLLQASSRIRPSVYLNKKNIPVNKGKRPTSIKGRAILNPNFLKKLIFPNFVLYLEVWMNCQWYFLMYSLEEPLVPTQIYFEQ